MKRDVGLWIDHQKAVIVFVAGVESEIKVINSKLEKQHRQSGVLTPADDIRQRQLTGHLNTYYDEVLSYIRDAESILILGPGEAKYELKKRLEIDKLSEHLVGIEPADKMTEPQIVARVRSLLLKHRAATS
jgi:hypothetical protein